MSFIFPPIVGNDMAVPPRGKPLHAPRHMVNGSIPADGGNLLLSAGERTDLIARHPKAAPCIREQAIRVRLRRNHLAISELN